mgnify:CR=1 FL=1|jgi:acylphosphatase|tara:strand:+ start:592 stop:864 length:273 start_codon:yes stop_codon:yes gene_type:complete
MEILSVSLSIHGRVQGVYFRASAQKKAKELGITGWVQNCFDGTVESHAEGPKKQLEDFITWCHQGPPAAYVTSVECNSISIKDYSDFDIR